jgi:hypothetical protein
MPQMGLDTKTYWLTVSRNVTLTLREIRELEMETWVSSGGSAVKGD